MATIKIDSFGGVVPRVHPSLLPDGMATVAENCRLKSGKLVPLRRPEQIEQSRVMFENGLQSISDANSLYCWKFTEKDGQVRTVFLAFPGEVYFSKSDLATDVYDRIVVSGETGVSYTDTSGNVHPNTPAVYVHDRETGEITRHSICKDWLSPLRVSVSKSGGNTSSPRWLGFFVTWFDELGYESPMSSQSLAKNPVRTSDGEIDPSATPTWKDELLECNDGDTIRFESIAVPPEAAGIRVYKTNTGTEQSSAVQFCFEMSGEDLVRAQSGFTKEVSGMDAGEVCPSIEPAPYGLTEITLMDHGFYVGRLESEPHSVYFSGLSTGSVGALTNWPEAYAPDVGDNIQRLAVVSSTVYVLTDGNPYVISGLEPDQMSVARIGTAAACVSRKGVFVMDNRLYFVSNRGLFVIGGDADSGTVCRCITEQLFTKEQWQDLNPSSALLYGHDGALYMFFTKEDGEHVGYILDLADSSPVLTTHDEYATCMCVDDRTDDMYFVRDTEAM